jgi:hypothetical protein
VKKITEEKINVSEKLQEIEAKLGKYKEEIVNQFKDMEIEVKTWNFAVGKTEAEYNVNVNLNFAIRPKKKE